MVNTVGKEISEVDRAYLAGFFDGDGAIMAVLEKHEGKRFGFRIRVIVKLSQKDSEVLHIIQNTYAIGLVKQNQRSFDWLIRKPKRCI